MKLRDLYPIATHIRTVNFHEIGRPINAFYKLEALVAYGEIEDSLKCRAYVVL